ncbi:MAG: PASTA domain-containing protein [Bacteroidia bacterium]|nr:PASTA domain-containing protein [Bacteroidia bacterium]
MKGFFSFLKSKQFFLHFGIALITVFITLWILVKSLNSYTQHGDSVEVPDFKGKTIAELNGFIEGKDVRYQIIDSIYAPKEKPGVVVRQDPETKTKVKRNRTIYLYVNGLLPPQMAMPKLIDRSERQAISMLESYGLKVGRITQVAGDCNGCVLGQFIKGKAIEPGTRINKGTVVDLSIGKKDRFVNATSSDTTSHESGTNFDDAE